MRENEFTIVTKEDYTLLEINSIQLDAVLAPRLKSELVVLSGSGVRNILLDMKNCQYCDSSGLSAILVGNRLCRNAGGRFIICGLTPAVERLVTISQLDTVLSIAYSQEQIDDFFSH